MLRSRNLFTIKDFTPPLGAPATVVGAAGFGSITSAGDPRVLQFGLKVNF